MLTRWELLSTLGIKFAETLVFLKVTFLCPVQFGETAGLSKAQARVAYQVPLPSIF